MENRKFCPIEEALLRIEASAKTNRDLLDTLYFLQKVISSLLSQPNDWRCCTLQKENELFAQQLFNWEEVQHFLKLIGLMEKDGAYEPRICDESMKFLEATLKILNTHIQKLNISFIEEKPYYEIWKDNRFLKKSKTMEITNDSLCKKILEPKTRCTKLKEVLSRHLKQDRSEKITICDRKKCEPSDASFNSEGYYYQTCPKNSNKKKKPFGEEMFDSHDFGNNKRCCALFKFLKLG
jgi:hypothetical protein